MWVRGVQMSHERNGLMEKRFLHVMFRPARARMVGSLSKRPVIIPVRSQGGVMRIREQPIGGRMWGGEGEVSGNGY